LRIVSPGFAAAWQLRLLDRACGKPPQFYTTDAGQFAGAPKTSPIDKLGSRCWRRRCGTCRRAAARSL